MELLLRYTAPIYKQQITDQELSIGFPRAINADDYRGAAVPLAKAGNEWRLLALGDSVTFGIGVAEADAWPARLQTLLNHPAAPVTVINAGMEGASLSDLAYAFKKKWQWYRPDRVLLLVTGNMVSLAETHRDERPVLPAEHFAAFRQKRDWQSQLRFAGNRLIHGFCLPSLLSLRSQQAFFWLGILNHNLDPRSPYGALLAHGYRQGDLDPALAEEAWQLFHTQFARLYRIVKGAGADLELAYVGPRFLLSSDLADNAKNVPTERLAWDPVGRAKLLAAEFDVPFTDATSVLRRGRQVAADPLYLLLDYVHLSAAGHGRLSVAFAHALVPLHKSL